MVPNGNQDLLSTISLLLAEGKIDTEAAGKLLNTVARYEERIAAVDQTSTSARQDV